MQVYEQASISGTAITLTATELGYAPSGYTHHAVGVSGLANPAVDTWSLEVKPAGSASFYYVTTTVPSSGSYALNAMSIDAVRITFSATASAAALTVQSVARRAFISD